MSDNILSGVTGWLKAPFQWFLDFQKAGVSFFVKFVMVIVTSIATMLVAVVAIIGTIKDLLVIIWNTMGALTSHWGGIDLSGMFADAPTVAVISCIDSYIPLREIMAGVVLVVTTSGSILIFRATVFVITMVRKLF